MTADELLKIINGLPFIDASFEPQILLSLVASLRAKADGHSLSKLQDYLMPDNAVEVYNKNIKNTLSPPACTLLDKSLTIKLNNAISRITKNHNGWLPLFAIPLEWRELTTGQISLTNPLLPQYIYLGRSAFEHELRLEETIIHEMSHVWCGLIAEIMDFQKKNSPHDLILPSGTEGKNVRGVFFAALFAAAALNLYRIVDKKQPTNTVRINYLQSYLLGCINVINDCDGASCLGQKISDHLTIFLQKKMLLNEGERHA